MYKNEEQRLINLKQGIEKLVEESIFKTQILAYLATKEVPKSLLVRWMLKDGDKEIIVRPAAPPMTQNYNRSAGQTAVVLEDCVDKQRMKIEEFTSARLRKIFNKDKSTDIHIIFLQMLKTWLVSIGPIGDTNRIKQELSLMKQVLNKVGTMGLFESVRAPDELHVFLTSFTSFLDQATSECDILLDDAQLTEILGNLSENLGKALLVLHDFLALVLSSKQLKMSEISRESIILGQTPLEGFPLRMLERIVATPLYSAVLPIAGDRTKNRPERIETNVALQSFSEMIVSRNPLLSLKLEDEKIEYTLHLEEQKEDLQEEGVEERFKQNAHIIKLFKELCGMQYEFARLRLHIQNATRLSSMVGTMSMLDHKTITRKLKMVATHTLRLIKPLEQHVDALDMAIQSADRGNKKPASTTWRRNRFHAIAQKDALKARIKLIQKWGEDLGKLVERGITETDRLAAENALKLFLAAGQFYDDFSNGLHNGSVQTRTAALENLSGNLYWLLFLSHVDSDTVEHIADKLYAGTGERPSSESLPYWKGLMHHMSCLSSDRAKMRSLLEDLEVQAKRPIGLTPIKMLLKAHLRILLGQSPAAELLQLVQMTEQIGNDNNTLIYGYFLAYLCKVAKTYNIVDKSLDNLSIRSMAYLNSQSGMSLKCLLVASESEQPASEHLEAVEESVLRSLFATTQRRKSEEHIQVCLSEFVLQPCRTLPKRTKEYKANASEINALLPQLFPGTARVRAQAQAASRATYPRAQPKPLPVTSQRWVTTLADVERKVSGSTVSSPNTVPVRVGASSRTSTMVALQSLATVPLTSAPDVVTVTLRMPQRTQSSAEVGRPVATSTSPVPAAVPVTLVVPQRTQSSTEVVRPAPTSTSPVPSIAGVNIWDMNLQKQRTQRSDSPSRVGHHSRTQSVVIRSGQTAQHARSASSASATAPTSSPTGRKSG